MAAVASCKAFIGSLSHSSKFFHGRHSFSKWQKIMVLQSNSNCLVGQDFSRLFCSKVLLNSEVTVDYKKGLPVIALPLPSRREICEFTLKPLSQTVGDFTSYIKLEDGGVDSVSFYSTDGTRIAKSTGIDILMQSEFEVAINDVRYKISPPVIAPPSDEGEKTLTDVKLLVSQLYSTLNVESYQLERERGLLMKLEKLKEEIAPMEEKAESLTGKANTNTHRLSWLGMGLMSLQFGLLARLTWWEYSWDIMEPVTYFVTYGTSMIMFGYFLLTKQEYLFPDAKDRQFLIKFHKLAQKEQLDVKKYNEVKDAIAEAEDDLRRLRDPLQIHLPIRELERIPKNK